MNHTWIDHAKPLLIITGLCADFDSRIIHPRVSCVVENGTQELRGQLSHHTGAG